MSDTKNHKKMFDVLQVAIKDKKLLVAILFQTMRDNPASIGNAYDKVVALSSSVYLCPRCKKPADNENISICLECWEAIRP